MIHARPSKTIVKVTSMVALLHFYIGWRVLPALPLDAVWRIAGMLWLLTSVCLMVAAFQMRGSVRQPWSDLMAWAGMLAMGLFSSLLVATLARDLLLLLAALAGFHSPQLAAWSALAVPALAFTVTLIGLINARRVAQVVEVEVPIAGLPPDLHGFSIVQISDVHVGPTIKRRYVDAIVRKVNRLDADVVALTGDLVDGSVSQLAAHTAPLAGLRARHGAYAVTGNHEYYSNAPAWIAELRRLGLTVLMNQHVLLPHGGAHLMLAGVTDFNAHHFDETHRSDPRAAIAGATLPVAVKVLLAHQPLSAPAAADAGFDLQLSGHTHGGQFFPWNFFVPLQQPFTAGLNRWQRMWVYTSRGTGYWGPPKRFGAPSEITRLRLVPA
jgi:predicted MPP superfamily phosphohydrolase